MSVRLSELSWKALLAGTVTILVFGLIMQLVFVSTAAGQMIFSQHFPQWAQVTQWALYALGLLLFLLTMSLGGYIAARLAKQHLLFHGVLVAVLTGSVTFAQSLSVGGLTWFGLVFFILGIPFTLFGCWYWIKVSASKGASAG
ncbi:hypothetical protein [Sedimenticola selenatireducens]|uniref:Uncharacterized protein n=1 Tax=Sedimenticola selenatireducens TaxID=191960 RepID=A0A557RY32_9GAMM|nr:hypothetical protein [Sedimenticola selenatireducens]TVO70054.1 hypothetical protein FHP88_17180 [Sedimenticola selenatireducens]TVT61704.1 MAG: hypothetical protein FHK78_16705 [Sedimenticola selenatireducens]